MYLTLSVFTGFMVALMIQFNGVLQGFVGGSTALLSIHLCGLLGAVVFLFSNRKRLGGDPEFEVPKFYLTAGMFGTLIVFLASVIFNKGGILFSLSGALAGQTLAASIAESFYHESRERSSVLQRIISPALLIPASIIIGFKAGASLPWIILSWVPGIVLMLQQSMNASNSAYYGTPKTIVFNYVSALILIVPIFIISGVSVEIGGLQYFTGVISELSTLPWYIIAGGGLIGVFTTGSIAFLLLKAPALLVILGIYTGELTGGIILDLYSGNPIAVEKIIGIILIAAGLGSGKIQLKPAAE